MKKKSAKKTLLNELAEVLTRYSDEEVMEAALLFMRSVRQVLMAEQDSKSPRLKTVRSSKSFAGPTAIRALHRNKAHRLLNSFDERQLKTMSTSELRRLAAVAGVPSNAKESRARLLLKLTRLSGNAHTAKPQLIRRQPNPNEYGGWVKMIVGSHLK